MGGLAAIARQAGHRVTGCDANVYPPMSTQLAALRIDLIEGYGADQLALSPDLWVIGNVVKRGNSLMEAILDRGDRFVSGPQWLSEQLLFGKWVLAVAGTHGKTTTASMLAEILEVAGKAPGFLIGGVPMDFGVSARLTESPYFVIEADEYDTAFFDKRAKFVHYRPKTAILNNLEYDHADIFSNIAEIELQFHHFVRIVPSSGLVVANGLDAALERVLTNGIWTPLEKFGVADGWACGPVESDGSTNISWLGSTVGRLTGQVAGEHNRMNALAAIAAARHVGVDAVVAIEALGRFSGVKRRMELRGRVGGIEIYDDFAHHPTAIRATIEGLRQRAPSGRILAVLDPRSNTMKRGVLKDELPSSLASADAIYLYASGLEWDPKTVFADPFPPSRIATDLAALIEAVAADAREGDRVLVMSNGGFGDFHAKLLDRLAESR